MASKYRKKHPDRTLKVMFWPKAALSGFQGFMKARTNISEDGILMAALSEEDLNIAATGRYRTEKLSALLPEVQAGKYD